MGVWKKARAAAAALMVLTLSVTGSAAVVYAADSVENPAIEAEDPAGVPVSAAEENTAVSAEAEPEIPAGEALPEADVGSADTAASDVTVKRIRFAKDYKEVYDALKSANYYYGWDYWVEDDLVEYEAAAEESAAAPKAAGTGTDTGANMAVSSDADADYSETNVRTEGVDEADIVKTDGKYIYILRKQSDLTIVKADGAELSEISTIHFFDNPDWTAGGREFFINGSKLHIISQDYEVREDDDYYYYYSRMRQVTDVLTYDISDPAAPVFEGRMRQNGQYREARMNGGKLYIFSVWYPDIDDDYADSMIVPQAGGKDIPAEQVCIPDIVTEAEMLIVTSVDPENPSEILDSKALVSGAEQLYVSGSGIYAANVDYRSSRTRTEIVKFTYEDGAIEGRAAGTIRGTVKDTFSIDEYDGNLRVLTTYQGTDRGELIELLNDIFDLDIGGGDRWTRHNALFILDENMNRIGKLSNLAEGEEIKSARFFGNIAYFVTFRNTDPLFTADLSDPRSPKILGQLKIPGFSAYLHPMGDNLLAGLGYDADPDNGSVTGIKLSLFDLTDPADVRETGKTTIDRITWCPAIENYKCVFADAGKKLIGFYCQDHYFVYRLTEEKTYERVLLYDFYADDLQGDSDYSEMRGLYIGDTFYLAGGSFVAAFDMGTFEREAVLRLGER